MSDQDVDRGALSVTGLRLVEPAGSQAPVRVAIVDDDASTRLFLRTALAAGGSPIHVVGEAADGFSGLDTIQELRPDVVLVDLEMPMMHGLDLIRSLRTLHAPPRVLVLSGNGDRDAVSKAIDAGADGYVLKGCRAAELREAVTNVAQGDAVLAPQIARSVVDDYQGLMERWRERDLAVIKTLASAVEARDAGTGNHCNNVAEYGLALWEEITGRMPDDDLVYGFLLHDIGKIAIPDAILLKPAKLTPEETEIMRRHVEIGVRIVEPLGFTPIVTNIISNHHERWDGTGYPNGLAGEAIPLTARVFSVVDAFDAMTVDRPYRKALRVVDALDELERHAGTQFDRECVDGFVRVASKRGLI